MSFEMNGQPMLYVSAGNWDDSKESEKLSGESEFTAVRRHTWLSGDMSVTDYNLLYAQEGKFLTIVTTDYDDRNKFKTYYGVKLTRITGTQESINMRNVRVTFNIWLANV